MIVERLIAALTTANHFGRQSAVVLSFADWETVRQGLREHLDQVENRQPVMEANVPRQNFLLRSVPVFCSPGVADGVPEFTTLLELDLPEPTGMRFRGDYS